jgi:predicted amidohydrolase YtcJ
MDDVVGSLEVGKLADLVILSENPRKVDPDRLDQIRVVATYREGRRCG